MVTLQAWGRLEAMLQNMAEARRLFKAAAELQPDNEYVLQVRRPFDSVNTCSPSGINC